MIGSNNRREDLCHEDAYGPLSLLNKGPCFAIHSKDIAKQVVVGNWPVVYV